MKFCLLSQVHFAVLRYYLQVFFCAAIFQIYRHTLFESQRLGIAFVAMEFLVMKMPTKM